jgi:hypothetical protein
VGFNDPSKVPLLSLARKANYWIGRNATHTTSKKESTDQATRMQRWVWESQMDVYPAHWDKMMMMVVVVVAAVANWARGGRGGERGAWR